MTNIDDYELYEKNFDEFLRRGMLELSEEIKAEHPGGVKDGRTHYDLRQMGKDAL